MLILFVPEHLFGTSKAFVTVFAFNVIDVELLDVTGQRAVGDKLLRTLWLLANNFGESFHNDLMLSIDMVL